MRSKVNSNDKNLITILFTVIGLLFIVTIITKMIKEIRENSNSEIVSEEGKEILQDPERKKRLREAVNSYHKDGNWDMLDKV